MRICFFGTPAFAASLLKSLIKEGYSPIAIVTQPDKPQGRSKKVNFSSVKEIALSEGIKIFQPLKASDPLFLEELRALRPDLLVVVAYGQILKLPLLEMAPLGVINVHASLLPKLRGAAPIQWAIINGESFTGITIMKMSLGMDEGDILLQESCNIDPSWNADELRDALIPVAEKTLLQVLKRPHKPIPQNHLLATYTSKLELVDSYIDFKKDSQNVYNHIRGCNKEPGSWTKIVIKGELKKLKILQASLAPGEGLPCTVLNWDSKCGIIIACKKGAILLDRVQLEGKKSCPGNLFTVGYCKDIIKIA